MKRKGLLRCLFLFCAALGFYSAGFAQSEIFAIEGKVNDPAGNKAAGAVIVIKGTSTGTVTDINGMFSINLPSKEAVLVITHFSTPEVWEDTFEAGKKYVIKLAADTTSKTAAVFDRVEERPRPVDGMDGWMQYLAKHIKYPQAARESGSEGTVIVSFVVGKDGSLQNVEVIRGIGGECDQEAVRVIASAPKWSPGKISGEAVNTRMSVPIQFRLDGSQNKPSDQKESAIAKLYGEKTLLVVGYQAQASR